MPQIRNFKSDWDDPDLNVDDLITNNPTEVNEILSRQAQLPLIPSPTLRHSCRGHSGATAIVEGLGANPNSPKNKRVMKSVGGASGGDLDPACADFVVDCAGVYSASRTGPTFVDAENCNERFLSLENHVHAPDLLELNWRDMGIPPVGLGFWVQLWALLPMGHTIVCCHGGHGRTGTALAALALIADPASQAGSMIDMVRADHCLSAIETSDQESYIFSLQEARDAQTKKNGAKK